ncbi:MAG: winged helix-turn-helix domain-containing protein [Candidatus Hodarchaeales archaeon]|jgi:predicted DNA-binding transcriptional regulator
MNKEEIQNIDGLNDYEDLLQGKVLQVYWLLLTKGESGISEIQKKLNITSSGTVHYQINKLVKAGLVVKNQETEKYFVIKEIKTGTMGYYTRVGSILIPRFFFYLSFFIFGLFFYFILILSRGDSYVFDPIDMLFISFIGGAISIFLFESIKIRELRPK